MTELTFTVSINQNHIDEGIKASVHSCPAALAIIDTLQQNSITEYYPVIGKSRVSLVNNDTYILAYVGMFSINDSIELTKWINDFDTGVPVNPISFDIQFVNDF
jgi:hypothetical protein